MKKLYYIMLILCGMLIFFNTDDVSAANSTSFSVDEVSNASGSVQSYVEANHQLPNNVTISGTTVSMPQFLKLETTAVYNINNNITKLIALGSYNSAFNPSETIINKGNLTNTSYLTLASNVKSFMDSNGRAPNYQSTSLGNMRFESLVYTFSQILNSYRVARVLPNFITIIPWAVVSNNSTGFITMGQINNAAGALQSYVEANHQLPASVTLSNSKVSMPQFLKLETTYLLNAKDNLYQSIVLGNYNPAPNPSETITGGNLESTDYLNLAGDIISFMDANGRAPNFKTTIRGSIRYESLVYIYAEIISSASKNQGLSRYITLVPWGTVSNNSTVFLTMDQINTAASTVKFYVETNKKLPTSLTISGREMTMAQFLKLEVTSLKNIYAGLYTSIILVNYGPATNPSETVTKGKLSYENYLNLGDNIKSYMDTNGKAPGCQSSQVGNMRFESMVYLYSQLLNYYNVVGKLPQYIMVNPWSVVTNPSTVTFNGDQVISGAETVQAYVEANHKLPTNVTISGTTVTMPQFLKLATTTLLKIDGGTYSSILLGNYNTPTSSSETITGGKLNSTDYLNLARDVDNFMHGNGRAPNYQTTSLGNIRYESLVYMFSQVLSSYKVNNYTLPDFITLNPWSTVSSTSTVFFTLDQIKNASSTVKYYVENNHKLPSNVTIAGTVVTMPQFLKLETTAVSYINGDLNASIVLLSYIAAPNPSETVKGGGISSTDYLNLADIIIFFMNSNGRAPNYQTTSLGNIRYESLVFLYSQILNYYSTEQKLPQNVTVDKWAVVSNVNKPFFTLDQIKTAAGTVQSYVEANHQLPSSVNISGMAVTMPQFLQLATTAVLNINDGLFTSFVLGSYDAPPSPSESITNTNFHRKDYLSLASEVSAFMYANGRAPNYKITASNGNIQYHSLIYLFSQILNSNNATNALPLSITITPWATVSNSNTVFITTDQLKTAAEIVKSYVGANHQLPSNITIAGKTLTMPQFLKLSAEAVVNIENYLKTSLVLESVGASTSPTENITSGTIFNGEFVDLAQEVLSYMDTNGTAPNNVSDSSLGDTIRYESLIYMFAEILISYNATEHPPDQVSVIPWLTRSNPDGTFNFRTQEIFSSIQAAIDDTDTISGDTIWLAKSIYSENVTINKKVVIRPVSGVDVTVKALNPNLPVFTMNTTGSGSTIQDFTITGSTGNAGFYINGSNDNKILRNNITGNHNGIYICNSTGVVVSGNGISNNTADGVFIILGSDNEISSNQLTGNGWSGINIQNSDDNGIYSNNICNNQDGILLNNSSTEVHMNRIVVNSRYGLYNQGNGTVDANNNWWGSNNPTISATGPGDIYVPGGTVKYDPWLLLTITSSTDRSDRTGSYYNYFITADLTHNNKGEDTSGDGNVPDDISIDFITTLGAINSSESARNGKAEVKLTSTAVGVASVSTSLDQQTVTAPVNITSVDMLGVYNTRTGESFASIQEAVDDFDTINGDTITLADGTYTENVAVDKRLTIKPATGATVTVKANDSDENVVVINVGGSGSTIQDLNIMGSPDSYGMVLSHAFNINLINNTISGSNRGVYLYQSGNNTLTGNNINNNYYGVVLYQSTSNTITGGSITRNMNGIYFIDSNNNLINGATIIDNWYGTYLYHSNCNTISGSTVEGNWVGVYLYNTNNNLITGNNFTGNGVGITYYNSMGTSLSGNTFTDNWLSNTSLIDSGEMVMATTMYSCGPAALVTLLKNLGIYTTEAELATLAGTDETGTSLYGLKIAAQAKGATAIGARLTTDQLKANYILVLNIDGTNHFEVIKNITSTTVTLIDPNLGTIEMSRDKFNELYTGVALIINGSAPAGSIILTDDELRNIKANGWQIVHLYSYWVPVPYISDWEWIDFGGITVSYPYFDWDMWQWRWGSYYIDFGGIWVPIIDIYWQEVPVYGAVYVPDHEITLYYYEIEPDKVKKRTEYGGKIIAGLLSGAASPLSMPAAIYLIWEGMNEYSPHMDELGPSIKYITLYI